MGARRQAWRTDVGFLAALALMLALAFTAAACDSPADHPEAEGPASTPTSAQATTPWPIAEETTAAPAESPDPTLCEPSETLPTDSPKPASTDDRAALASLYHATNGPNWTTGTNWLSDAPVGDWHGVTADPTGHVTELRLADNNLRGRIPPTLRGLAMLRVLHLGDNHLRGPIPPELGYLAQLEALVLVSNRLSRAIPSALGRLATLRVLDLRDNQLQGAVPSALGRLGNLDELWLGGSNQLVGCIPEELGYVRVGDLDSLGLTFCGPRPVETPMSPRNADRAALVALYHTTGGAELA